MTTLFDYAEQYPTQPGFKATGTSQEAAKAMAARAPTLRDQVLVILRRHGPRTADEVATLLGKTEAAIRPRLSELYATHKVEKTGARRLNRSLKAASVWRLVP